MKNSLLLTGVAILLLGITQKFDGQERTQNYRKLPPGSKAVIEQHSKMTQTPFFSRQESNHWMSDQILPYQHRMTNLTGHQDLRVNTASTGGAFRQHELSAGVDTAWVRHYSSGLLSSHDLTAAIAIDGSGNIYVTGSSAGYPSGYDYLTIKYNSSGAQLWLARYNGPGNSSDMASALAVDVSGNVYVTGTSYGSDMGGDYATIKYNSEGVEQWVARYSGSGDYDIANALAVDSFGNAYVTGTSQGPDTGEDYATIKYNSAGVQQWIARYNGTGNNYDSANALAVDKSGNVYVTGTSRGSDTGDDYATVKYNSDGVEQWVARYDGPGNSTDYANALAVDGFGNVYVTGESDSSSSWPRNSDYATVKYNSEGVEQWVARYNGPGDGTDSANALAVDGSGNIYVTGSSYGSGTDSDYATIKYNSAGIQQWVARYNGPGNGYDRANALAVDGFGNVYVTGSSDSSGRYFATIKYNSAGIQQWVVRCKGANYDYDYAIGLAVDASGNVHVIGSIEGTDTDPDYATIKYNSNGAEQWLARYNGSGNSRDEASALVIDAAGNVYVTGRSASSIRYPWNYDYATVKYNSTGVEQWVARYNGPINGPDEATGLAVDASGNVYVTGRSGTSISNPYDYDYATVKYNSAGIEQWVARYNGPINTYEDYPPALAIDASGNVYVTGESGGDYATIKYNSAGIEQWVARYNGPGNDDDSANALAVDGFGNVYVTGYSKGSGTWYDFATVKYNATGIEQWVARYNDPVNGFDEATALVVDPAGNVYVTGSSYGLDTYFDYATIKYNSAGAEQWVAYYNDSEKNYGDQSSALAVDASGNVYVTGTTGETPDGYVGPDYATVKYNSSGAEQWVSLYSGPEFLRPQAKALAVDASGNVYVTGGCGTVKYNSEGVEQWVARYNGRVAEDGPRALALDASDNVYVTGISYGDYGIVYTTTKYVQTPVSVDTEEFKKPSNYWLAQNYPNPFNPATTIEFTLPKSAFVTLKIYNLLGEEVATLVAEQRTAGIHKVNWDARGLASGVYLYRLEAGEFTQTKKLILIR